MSYDGEDRMSAFRVQEPGLIPGNQQINVLKADSIYNGHSYIANCIGMPVFTVYMNFKIELHDFLKI